MKEVQNAHFQTGCPIFVELDEAPDKLFSQIVGFQDGKYVIISQPTSRKSVSPRLKIGSTAVIKYVHEGSIIAFRTPVVDQIQSPDKLVFVSFPKEVTRQNLRSQKRYTCNFPAKIQIGNETAESRLEDISQGGCCCSIDNVAVSHLEKAPMVGDSVILTVQQPGSSTWDSLPGRVSNTFGRADRTHYGIAIEQKDPDIENLIKQIIFQTLTS